MRLMLKCAVVALVFCYGGCVSSAKPANTQALGDPRSPAAPEGHSHAMSQGYSQFHSAAKQGHAHEGHCSHHFAEEHPVKGAAKDPLKDEIKMGDEVVCPVSKETFTAASHSPHLQHQGKTIYFCCDECMEQFKQNPEKYIK